MVSCSVRLRELEHHADNDKVYEWAQHKDVCYKLYIEDRKVRELPKASGVHLVSIY